MPWEAKTVEQTRAAFVQAVERGTKSKSALCREYGISRPTGDKWLKRHVAGQSMCDQSRAPFRTPNKITARVESKILEVRKTHPAWGARKIRRILEREGETDLPAASTICAVLKRNGCVDVRNSESKANGRFERAHPNELWQTDFKGHFEMENGQRCHPLTVLDDHSRFSLCIDAKKNERASNVKASFERLFDEYGLPKTLLCDNGPPWGTPVTPGAGYTEFEVWLMDYGIWTLHGRPRHPQTQGKEERFHGTMSRELLQYKQPKDIPDAQVLFDEFRHCYNHVRPHHALNLDTPAQHYCQSVRKKPQRIEPWEYAKEDEVRSIGNNGYFSYRCEPHFLSEAFRGRCVALRPTTTSGILDIYYRQFKLAVFDARSCTFLERRGRCVL